MKYTPTRNKVMRGTSPIWLLPLSVSRHSPHQRAELTPTPAGDARRSSSGGGRSLSNNARPTETRNK